MTTTNEPRKRREKLTQSQLLKFWNALRERRDDFAARKLNRTRTVEELGRILGFTVGVQHVIQAIEAGVVEPWETEWSSRPGVTQTGSTASRRRTPQTTRLRAAERKIEELRRDVDFLLGLLDVSSPQTSPPPEHDERGQPRSS